ncbi:hypothetical protein B0J13DRAFT_527194 [Dactylonectria estremocensis]|uniref:Uncharacterized protein n=1 Tax=Dactylonectria estremocensis TaxID=1079267 RepID=A0A9P9ENN4_9HYPO|nr:hypothetical protein B0J13DRAFT_527194 [Dactylonectria estremocensis]
MNNRKSCPAALADSLSSAIAELSDHVVPENNDDRKEFCDDVECESLFSLLSPLDTETNIDLHLSVSDSLATSHRTNCTAEIFLHSCNSSLGYYSATETRQTPRIFSRPSKDNGTTPGLECAGIVASVARVIDGKGTNTMGSKVVEQKSQVIQERPWSNYRGQEAKQREIVCLDHLKSKDDATYDLLCSSPQHSPSSGYVADDASLRPESEPDQEPPTPCQPVVDEPEAPHHGFEKMDTPSIQDHVLEELLHQSPAKKEQHAIARLLGCRNFWYIANESGDSFQPNHSTFSTMAAGLHATERSKATCYADGIHSEDEDENS